MQHLFHLQAASNDLSSQAQCFIVFNQLCFVIVIILLRVKILIMDTLLVMLIITT